MSDESEKVEAFFEGADNVYDGAQVNFSSQKIIIREKGDATKHSYTNKALLTLSPYHLTLQLQRTQPQRLLHQLIRGCFSRHKTLSGCCVDNYTPRGGGTGATFKVTNRRQW